MFRTLYLGKLQGAKIYIHWSFWVLAVFVFLSGLSQGLSHAIALLGFVLAVFGCVFLHELGHAVAAKAFGKRTHDITLLPIGGVARIEGGNMSAVAEGWVAIAGPAVNFVIALALLIGSSLSGATLDFDPGQVGKLSAVQQLIVANLVLGIFNLLPAFPLDGGRLLRSVLCYWLDRPAALQLSSRIGQWTSGLLLLSSIVWWNGMGILFGIVLFLINTFQRLQARVAIAATEGSIFESAWPPNPPFDGSNRFDDSNTIDAVEVREVRSSSNRGHLGP
jgi:Zn-dependent protease